MIEILSLVSILALFLGLALRDRAREIRHENDLHAKTASLRGRDLAEAKSTFGEPAEVVIAASGWRLYIWRVDGVEITLTIDPASVVTDAACQII